MAVEAKYDKNPGIMGKIHGDRKEESPAMNAMARLMIVRELIFPPALVPAPIELKIETRN